MRTLRSSAFPSFKGLIWIERGGKTNEWIMIHEIRESIFVASVLPLPNSLECSVNWRVVHSFWNDWIVIRPNAHQVRVIVADFPHLAHLQLGLANPQIHDNFRGRRFIFYFGRRKHVSTCAGEVGE